MSEQEQKKQTYEEWANARKAGPKYQPGYMLASQIPDYGEIEHAIDVLFPLDAITVFAAKSEAGKTIILFNVADGIVRRLPYVLGYPPFKNNVGDGLIMMSMFEQNKRSVSTIMNRLGWTKTHRDQLLIQPGVHELKTEIARFTASVIQNKPRWAVGDTLAYLLTPDVKEMGDYLGIVRAFAELRQALVETKCALTLTAHARKLKGEDLDSILGTTGTGASIDRAMIVVKENESDPHSPRKLLDIKVRIGFGDVRFPPLDILYDRKTYGVRVIPLGSEGARPKPKSENEVIDENILENIRAGDGKPISQNKAVARCGKRGTDARKRLEKLVDAKLVVAVKGGYLIGAAPVNVTEPSDTGHGGPTASARPTPRSGTAGHTPLVPSMSAESGTPGTPDTVWDTVSLKASIPVMITKAMEAALRAKGYDREVIDHMTPQQAHDILRRKVPVPQASMLHVDLDEALAPPRKKITLNEVV